MGADAVSEPLFGAKEQQGLSVLSLTARPLTSQSSKPRSLHQRCSILGIQGVRAALLRVWTTRYPRSPSPHGSAEGPCCCSVSPPKLWLPFEVDRVAATLCDVVSLTCCACPSLLASRRPCSTQFAPSHCNGAWAHETCHADGTHRNRSVQCFRAPDSSGALAPDRRPLSSNDKQKK